MKILDPLLHQLSQNSTWRGIILLATSCGVALTPSHQEAIVAAGLALVGLINVLRKG
jgi:hypothetical protein